MGLMTKGVSPDQHQIEGVRNGKIKDHRVNKQVLPKHLIVEASFKELLPFMIIFIIAGILVALI